MYDKVSLRDLLAANFGFILFIGLLCGVLGAFIGAGKTVTDAPAEQWYSVTTLLTRGSIIAGIVLGVCGMLFFPNPSWQVEMQQHGTSGRATMGCGCAVVAGALAWLSVAGISVGASKGIEALFGGWDGGAFGTIIGGSFGFVGSILLNVLHFWISLFFVKE